MYESPPKKISCPTCSKETQWDPANAFRPFCSDRCRTIDLGGWFLEQNAIPCEPDTSELDA
jgi:endogenous inhibitor of DNA gyrase (YacG/DUF329 family)